MSDKRRKTGKVSSPAKALIEKVRKETPRVGFDGFHYYEICSDAYALVKEARSEVEKSRPPNGGGISGALLFRLTPRGQSLQHEIHKKEPVVITFAAMCLEACIWDYAACSMAKKKRDLCLKELSFVAKWIIIPELYCDSDITKVIVNGASLVSRLDRLRKARNDLVHSMSKPLPKNLTVTAAIKATVPPKRKIAVESAFGLIKPLLGELEKVDKTKWWFFESHAYRNVIAKSVETS